MKLSVRTLLLYALPALPLAALTLPLYIIVPTYYSETLGLSLGAVAATLAFVRIFDALNDPLFGWLADKWRPSFGRRRLFFLASLPLTALAALMLFWPPEGAGVIWLAVWSALLSIGYTASILPYTAWGAEMAGNYSERSRVAAFREGMTLAGTLAAISLPFAIGLHPNGGLSGLAILGIAVAILLFVFGGISIVAVAEPREYSVSRLTLLQGLSRMATNKPFVRLITAFLINGLANGIPATLFLYFVSDRLGVPDMRGPLLFLFFLCGVIGVPLALRASQHIGKHRAWCWAMLAACAVFAFAPLIGAGNVVAFGSVCVLTGITLGFDLALPPAIQADVIDVDTAESGEQRSGFYFAAWSLATKAALAASVAIAFPLLGLFGFSPVNDQNSPDALFALAALYAWLPVVLKLVAVALMWDFPLDEVAQESLRQRIENRSG